MAGDLCERPLLHENVFQCSVKGAAAAARGEVLVLFGCCFDKLIL